LLGLLIYAITWAAPHGREVWRYNNYYRTRQIQPRSLAQVARYAGRAAVGYRRGLAQFLETRTPVLTTLALIGLLSVPIGGGISIPRRYMPGRTMLRQDGYRVLWLWAVLGLVALAVSRYSPSRYYLIVYPPLAGLAALALWRLVPVWRWARKNQGSWRAAPLLILPASLLAYHLSLPSLNAWTGLGAHEARISQALALLAALGLMYGALLRARRLPRPASLATGALALFLLVSYGQWAHWFVTRDYRTKTVARELAALVRPDEVLAGDWAPNLCLDNRVRAVPVLPGLANWQHPVETLGADYVLVTQTPYPVRFWRRQAPQVVVPENLVREIRVHDYRLHLYRVPEHIKRERTGNEPRAKGEDLS
jgi:hypothetical protein